MHLDEERVQRLLHGELTPEQALSFRNHVATCVECRQRMSAAEEVEAWIYNRLREVDSKLPRIDAETVAARARSNRAGRSRAPRWSRWAAGVVLVMGLGGVAYATPGSPVRRWVDAVIASIRGVESAPDDSSPGLPGPLPPDPGSGIAVDPGRALVIVFATPPDHARARVTLIEGTQVVVQAPGGGTSFTADEGRLTIAVHGDSVEVQIQIPASAPRVEILVGRRRVLLKTGVRVIASPTLGADSSYLLPLGP